MSTQPDQVQPRLESAPAAAEVETENGYGAGVWVGGIPLQRDPSEVAAWLTGIVRQRLGDDWAGEVTPQLMHTTLA